MNKRQLKLIEKACAAIETAQHATDSPEIKDALSSAKSYALRALRLAE